MSIIPLIGSGWTPKKDGAAFWARSDRLVTPIDGKMAAWGDLVGGNNRNLTQSNAAQRLLYIENVINGFPVIRGDGTARSLNWTPWNVAGATEYEMWFVLYHNAPGTWKQLAIIPWADHLYHSGSSDGKPQFWANYTLNHTTAFSGWFILRFMWNNASKTRIQVNNGTLITKDNEAAPNATNTFQYLGRADTYAMFGDLAEVIIYPRWLSTEEALTNWLYTSRRYSVTLT